MYTFKFSNRMKLTIKMNTPNSYSFIVKGKDETDFRFGRKRAAELIKCFEDFGRYAIEGEVNFNKTAKCPAGKVIISNKDLYRQTGKFEVLKGDKV